VGRRADGGGDVVANLILHFEEIGENRDKRREKIR
jgi:hypothetical protein